MKGIVINIFLILLLVFGVIRFSANANPFNLAGRLQNREKDTSSLKDRTVKADSTVEVLKAYRSTANNIDSDTAALNDFITVKVHNLLLLLKRSRNYNRSDATSGNQDIRLYIDGREIKNLSPESGAPIKDEGELHFHLQRNQENDDTWADLLGAPKYRDNFFIKTCKLSVGLAGQYAENSRVSFHLVRMRKGWLYGCMLGFVIYLIALFVLAKRSNILKDGVQNKFTGLNIPQNFVYQYSLGRFQMAFWFSLVIASFLFIWLITGAYDTITPGILALIGISAGTSLSATVIDNSKNQEILANATALEGEKLTLNNNISALKAQTAANPPLPNVNDILISISTKSARLQVVQQQLNRAIGNLKPNPSKGFFLDILSDINGVSFHRLQMFVWTLVLGILFFSAVWSRLSMPEFSSTMLGLQGLAAGTYLGFKIPEKQT